MIALLSLAYATSGFDATKPEKTFTGVEVESLDGAYRLWSAIERIKDPDTALFTAGEYNSATEWPDDASYAPYIATCFGSPSPHTSLALLHVGPSSALASGTPNLFVPGAGDNASRGFVVMATHFDLLNRPVYALTFAHPHGDVFQQAELIADAIARIRARTGAAQVDLVAHSKGGIASAVYLSNLPKTEWENDTYASVGTHYRGDVRRAVFIATPLGGIDTAFRWPDGNYLSLNWDDAFSPSSWGVYYPYGTGYAYTNDLSAQDFLSDGGDLFPGQRQILARQSDYELPGENTALGAYSLQQDWYTTYEGGIGFYSISAGIDDAIADGGNLLEHLAKAGVDPSVEIFLLAGNNAVMPNGTDDYLAVEFGGAWDDMATASKSVWSQMVGALVGDGLMSEGITQAEAQGLADGALILGEVSGESDGLVFVTSATDGAALTKRGAKVGETKVVNLSHLDLLYASPITGDLLVEASTENVDDAWMAAFGNRYTEADTIGWVEDVLADDEVPDDTGDTDDTGNVDSGVDSGVPDSGDADADTGTVGGNDDGAAVDDDPYRGGCGACDGSGGAGLGGLVSGIAAFFAGRRRR